MWRVWVRIIHLTMAPTRHISEFFFKWRNPHCLLTPDQQLFKRETKAFQIQRETKAFLLIVRHNTEGPPISDWQWRHWMPFFFVGSQNRVNLVLFFKPWYRPSGLFFPCPFYFFPYLLFTSYFFLFICFISFLLIQCASAWENTRAWVTHFL